jgi:hypothetical protein
MAVDVVSGASQRGTSRRGSVGSGSSRRQEPLVRGVSKSTEDDLIVRESAGVAELKTADEIVEVCSV